MKFDETFFLRIPAILLALTIHELAHAYVARHFGDHTAEQEGRITMNPLAHLDLIGTLMLLAGPFGWAKPVPVNPYFLRNPKRDMAIVAAAGPISNILLAGIAGLTLRFGMSSLPEAIAIFLFMLFAINIGLAIFNMLPIYPLDGSRVLLGFLDHRQSENFMRAMTIVPQIFIGIIVAGWVFNTPILGYILGPIFNPVYGFFRNLFIGF